MGARIDQAGLSRMPAAAAPPSVIGGPGSDFTRSNKGLRIGLDRLGQGVEKGAGLSVVELELHALDN